MRRSAFLMIAAVPLLPARRALAQSDADPATSSSRPALRVLLGPGDASTPGNGTFEFQGRFYRGSFTRLDDGRIVNLVDLEAYVCSVVPAEMSPHRPPGALESQSICARTYVLQRSDPRRAYDLVPSELDQVYRGIEGESPNATAAVSATAGRVLRYNAAFAQIAYSSCCGGHTEASSDAWGSLPIPYLAGVVCTSCGDSPYFRWSTFLTLDQLAQSFAAPLAGLGVLDDFRITTRDPSGRARAFELLTSAGSTVVQGGAFRRTIGVRTLRSLLIMEMQRSQDGTAMTIDGGGLGHGVGLCQWGAHGMALAGAGAPAILAYYFPGTVVEDLER
ncbi:MAG: SpoIID/LytB domain-containing protein [Candidatus Cybelea sp.]